MENTGKMEPGYYLGLDVGGCNLAAGVVDNSYRIISKRNMPTHAGRGIEEITTDMAEICKAVVSDAGLKISDMSSWGIGMPSCINPGTNLLVHANCFGWKNVPIYDYLRKHIDLPLYIANDADCATLGETLAGAASKYSDVIMLTLGTGVGSGIILNKKIYSGHDNMGAELGHTKLVYDGLLCTCGQKGCLEAYCSATALIRFAREAIENTPDSIIMELCGNDPQKINGKIIFEAVALKDKLAVRLLDEYASRLAAGISSFVTIFRPQIIIVGGGLADAGNSLLSLLNEKLYCKTFAAAEIGVPKIIGATLGNDAGIIGAALLEKQYE